MTQKQSMLAPNPAGRTIEKFIKPIQSFLALESASGILLLIATAFALFFANAASLTETYEHLIHFPVTLGFGTWHVSANLHQVVNDGLMVIFFYVVGLEIKREMLIGELSTPKKASLSIFGAIGGMVLPALIYTFFNHGTEGIRGWGIPMATDIAFSVGILSLLGKRVPFALKVFLLAFAIADDLGAVLVIAFFYTKGVVMEALGIGVIGLLALSGLGYAGVRHLVVALIFSFFIWICFLKSGVHATVAGVLIAFLTPSSILPTVSLKGPLKDTSFLDKWIQMLHPWVSFFIMPVFAFFNAGVVLHLGSVLDLLYHPVYLGVALGLLFGKPIGITCTCFLMVKLGLSQLPKGVRWAHLFGIAMLGGIGFTMSLFVSGLAFEGGHALEMFSKAGILSGSFLSGVIGSLALLLIFKLCPISKEEVLSKSA